MSEPLPEDFDLEDCWQCGGEGGYAYCQEDCCPHVGGEEDCDDPACWRRCSVCRGKGFLPVQMDTHHDQQA